MIKFNVEESALQCLIVKTILEVLHQQELLDQKLGSRVVYDEETAAELLALNPWQLRDLRREGKVGHTRVVGNRIRYLKSDLIRYLMARHVPATGTQS